MNLRWEAGTLTSTLSLLVFATEPVYLGRASGQTTLDTYAHVIGDVAIADFV